jgi:hypothetical protein
MNQVSDNNKKQHEDFIQNEFPVLIEMLNKHLDFKRWGFKLTHTGILSQYMPYIVYQSNQCQIRIRWDPDRPYVSPKLDMTYGRLHAPTDQYFMSWNGEECYCWHEIGKILNFLDGLSPSDTSNREFMVPRKMKSFYEKNKSLARDQHEYIIKLHAYIWDSYGQRFFDVFDLHHLDLWNQYIDFLKEYYVNLDKQSKFKGIPPSANKPPLYKIC